MTAGRGIIHEEYHSSNFAKTGGKLEMCQLWVNLPAKYKMTPPNYQPILNNQIIETELISSNDSKCDKSEGMVRIIAGEFNGMKGPATTFTQVDMWDIMINKSGNEYIFDTKPGNNVILFCRRGSVVINLDTKNTLKEQDVAVMDINNINTKFTLKSVQDNTSILVLAGDPIRESIANHGPFVMNTQEELKQAFSDFRSGNFGK